MVQTTPQATAFDQEFLDTIKQQLLEEKVHLEKELNSFAQKNNNVASGDDFDADFPNYGDEDDDIVHEVADYTVNKTLEITLENQLRDVNKALERLKEGTYGICKYTGNPIAKKRLLARPTSSSSIEAKKLLTNEI
ncbi:TraR/DksA family transcriptional regulator [Patescibacteria group bacterium]|nr:TraR/DksA family transcriptional regulator [Patescibacteria group bacterium]MBU1721305.1 TraR/DksA family transcriptional regulator [Patescibacteria group bacterium]MBU1900819.1 TraR/DksA family transcriptional regulator [Patescibacteria group bacterium]